MKVSGYPSAHRLERAADYHVVKLIVSASADFYCIHQSLHIASSTLSRLIMHYCNVFVLASLVVSSFASTVAEVKVDITGLSSQIVALDTAVNQYPVKGGTVADAVPILKAALGLGAAVDKTTADVKAVTPSPSVADSQNILLLLQAVEPKIKKVLMDTVAKKASFTASVAAGVKQDITTLRGKTMDLGNALTAKAPAVLLPQANALKKQIDEDFAVAVAAYA
ncbi:hydrophobic surface binding protein A-domain-containing protein [Lyophyllum atratum]|nr:hydrophobic surface binding protein A-domain-containing protein [Lyophyllum atratum]